MTQVYFQKAQQHAEEAFDFYKTNVYQGEYAIKPEVEEAFIQARLADIIGNSAPLSEFYKTLRQRHKDEQHQKLLAMIRAEQEAQRQREEEHRKQQTAEKSQQKVVKILLEQEKTDEPVSLLSSCETLSTSLNLPSVVTEPSQETRVKEKKVKTHGIAKPQPTSFLKDTPILEEERKKVALSSDDHHVFHSLTGGKFDRSISLDQVKAVLTSPALGCKISTGGSHPGKATAPNGTMWTIPSPWKGPIPHYYRQQLNEFLQNAMEIDPDDVIVK